MRIVQNIVLCCVVLIAQLAYPQKTIPVRLEVPSDISVESFHIEVLGEKGALIFYESNDVTEDGQRKWFFGLFDKSLSQKWLKFSGRWGQLWGSALGIVGPSGPAFKEWWQDNGF